MTSSDSILLKILGSTAWRMEPPPMYGTFHLVISAVLICLAFIGAFMAKHLSDRGRVRLLAACGWILAALELYKQLFIYYIVNDGVYDWWYFPFQLCSVPMYLCILLPLIARAGSISGRDNVKTAVLTFLAGYTFIGAMATFALPEDILRSYVTLTLHGFVWHGMLLFISLTSALSGMASLSRRGFALSTVLFLALCAVAVIINIKAEPVMAAAHAEGLVTNSYAAMFYLNPYHISPQPIVDTIQKSAGILAGLALYVITVIAAAGLTDYVFAEVYGIRRR